MIDWDSCVLWLDNRYFTDSYWWDRSKYLNDGIVYNAKFKGDSFFFNGIDNYVDCGNDESLNITDAITIEVWVRPKSINIARKVTAKNYDGTKAPYVIAITSDNKFRFYSYDNSVLFDTKGGTVAKNTWYHVVGTFNKNKESNQACLYVNGELVDSDTYTSPLPTNDEHVFIGYYVNSYFYGSILSVRIFNRALNNEEIKILYNLTYRIV